MKKVKKGLVRVLAFILSATIIGVCGRSIFDKLFNKESNFKNNISVSELNEDVEEKVPNKDEHLEEYNNIRDSVLTEDINEVENDKSDEKQVENEIIKYPLEDLDSTEILDSIEVDNNLKDEIKPIIGKMYENGKGYDHYYGTEVAIINYINGAIDKTLTNTSGEVDDDEVLIVGGVVGKICDWKDGQVTCHSMKYKENLSMLEELTDYIFFDELIEGTNFDNISTDNKINCIKTCLYIYKQMETKWSFFKNELEENSIYPSLEQRLIVFDGYLEGISPIDDDYETVKNYLSGNLTDKNKINILK